MSVAEEVYRIQVKHAVILDKKVIESIYSNRKTNNDNNAQSNSKT